MLFLAHLETMVHEREEGQSILCAPLCVNVECLSGSPFRRSSGLSINHLRFSVDELLLNQL